MENEKKLHTIIIGAGTTGLLVAQGLKKASLPYSLFEYETSTSYQTRPREWGMTMHWGSSHLASCLPPALAARISETYADPSMSADAVTGLPVHNGKTGELLMTMAGERPCRVSRRKLRKLFSEGLTIQYGKEFVEAVEEGGQVVAVFADGTRVVGDVLVGCDGARSRVREVVCGEEAARVTTVPVSMINFTQMYTAEQALHVRSLNPLFVTSIHPDLGVMFWLSIQDVPDPDKPETWTFQIFMSWMDNPIPETENNEAGRLAFVKRIAEQWAEPWKSAGLWVKEGTKIPIDSGTYWERAAPWDNRDGKMTLCGDAAHPMTPHRGQGFNSAIQDSSTFATAIKEAASGVKSLSEAIKAYDEEVFERGTREMQISLTQTKSIHDWGKLMKSPMVKIGMHQVKKGDTSIAE